MSLTKEERKQVRQKIESYHRQKLAELQNYVFNRFIAFNQGKISVFDLDQIIHIYHCQSEELFSFINTYYPSNDMLELLIKLIDEEENGLLLWEPKTKQKV